MRNARWYLAGQSFSLFGDTALAKGIWVKELTGSSGDAGLREQWERPAAAALAPAGPGVHERAARIE